MPTCVFSNTACKENYHHAKRIIFLTIIVNTSGRLYLISNTEDTPQPAFTCSNSAVETPEQCVKSIQS